MDKTDSNTDNAEFLANIASVRLKTTGRDANLLRLGVVMMPVGIILGVVGYVMAYSTDNSLDQRDAIILALIGVSVSVVGVGVFLRYSLTDFFRFWMARLVLQQELQARGAAPKRQDDVDADVDRATEDAQR